MSDDRGWVETFRTRAVAASAHYRYPRLVLNEAAKRLGWLGEDDDADAVFNALDIRADWLCSSRKAAPAKLHENEHPLLEEAFAVLDEVGLLPELVVVVSRKGRKPKDEDPTPLSQLPLEFKTPLRSQADLADLVGHYLILRRIFGSDEHPSRPGLLVSCIQISAGASADAPLHFRTRGAPSDHALLESAGMTGFVYQPANPKHKMTDDIYTLGVDDDTNAPRMSIFRRRLRPPGRPVGSDLYGVRLGLGAVDGQPRGYLIWGSRVDWDDKPQDEIAMLEAKWKAFFPFQDVNPTDEELAPLLEVVPNIAFIVRERLRKWFVRLNPV